MGPVVGYPVVGAAVIVGSMVGYGEIDGSPNGGRGVESSVGAPVIILNGLNVGYAVGYSLVGNGVGAAAGAAVGRDAVGAPQPSPAQALSAHASPFQLLSSQCLDPQPPPIELHSFSFHAFTGRLLGLLHAPQAQAGVGCG